MLLTIRQAYELLAKHGMFAREICDKCGRVLGAVRFTRRGDANVWCNRECRDGAEANAPGTCKHCNATLLSGKRKGSRFCDDACKQAAHRSKPSRQASGTGGLSVTNTSIYAGFSLKKGGAGVPPYPAIFAPRNAPDRKTGCKSLGMATAFQIEPGEEQGAPSGTLHAPIGPSRNENSMARKRYQRGRVFLEGKKKDKWAGRYREDVMEIDGKTRRVRRYVILGSKRELPTKRLAERKMDAILARINDLSYRPGRVGTFGEFIERWKTEVLTTQKPSSVRAVRSHLNCYIVPELGKIRLDQFGVENQQRFITRMPERAVSKAVSRKTIQNVLGTLSAILTTARNWGYTCEPIKLEHLRLPARGVKYEAPSFTVEQPLAFSRLPKNPGAHCFAFSRWTVCVLAKLWACSGTT